MIYEKVNLFVRKGLSEFNQWKEEGRGESIRMIPIEDDERRASVMSSLRANDLSPWEAKNGVDDDGNSYQGKVMME